MIKKVSIKNLMSWSGLHEIDYKEGITLFDGKYGAGKSSILVDSLDLVFSGKGRAKLGELITKGKKDMEIIVEMDINKEDYKFLFYYRKKTVEKGENGKDKKVAAKTIWKSFQKKGDEWVEISKSPESVLGVDYELVAKKTFLIGQFDLDTFSQAKPTEKYEIIAEAFQISNLFAIGDRAQDKVKLLISNKNLLEEQFKNIDTSDFDKKSQIEKNVNRIKKEIKESEEKINTIRNNIEETKLHNIKEEELNSVIENQKYLKRTETLLQGLNLKEKQKEIDLLKREIERSKNVNLEKIKNERDIEETKKSYLLEGKDNEIQTLKNQNIIEINNIKNNILKVVEELKDIPLYGNESLFKEVEEKENILKKINREKLEENVKKLEKKLQSLKIEEQGLTQDINKQENICQKIKSIKTEDSKCPTCNRTLTDIDKKHLLDVLSKEIKVVKENKEKVSQNILKIERNIKDDGNDINFYNLYQDYIKINKLKSSGKGYQDQLKEIKKKMEISLNEINKNYEKEIKVINENIEKYTKKIEKLEKEDKSQFFIDKLKELEEKKYELNGNYYTFNDLMEKEIETNIQLKDIDKRIIEIKKQLKEYKKGNLDTLNIKYSEIKEQIEENRHLYLLENNKLLEIKNNEENYKKVEKEIKEINRNISIFEKIKNIFGKKGEPKTILTNFIIPNLENTINEILEETTNGLYNVEFILDSETLDGRESKKNIFDIIVYQQGVAQTYDTLSGGERTNINYAIRLGITNTLNEILGNQVSDFLVLDEVFRGDLDSENGGESLVNSVIRTNESGRFKQIFIITHTEYIKEKLENSSNVIKIEKRGKFSELL